MFFGPLVDQDTQGWVLDSFDWAIDNGILTAQTRLIPPDKAHFPIPGGAHQDVARGLVAQIQTYLNMDTALDVRPLDVLPAEYRFDPNATSAVAGTWQTDGTTSVITYDPETAAAPIAFLSTLVHEVMHERLFLTPGDMPGGAAAEELSTDLHCIAAGFGLVQMTGAEQAGWQGYLRQETRAFALAVFLGITQTPDQQAHAALPRRSSKLLRKVGKLANGWTEDIGQLRSRLQSQRGDGVRSGPAR